MRSVITDNVVINDGPQDIAEVPQDWHRKAKAMDAAGIAGTGLTIWELKNRIDAFWRDEPDADAAWFVWQDGEQLRARLGGVLGLIVYNALPRGWGDERTAIVDVLPWVD